MPPDEIIGELADRAVGDGAAAVEDDEAARHAARDRGAGVLLVSEDLDELLALASRLVVLSHGRVALACSTVNADIASIGRAMAGDAQHQQEAA